MTERRIIDADGHILEPRGLWIDRMEGRFKDAAPRIERHEDGRELLFIEDRPASPLPISSLGSAGLGIVEDWDDNQPGGFDPRERIKVLDAEGIDATVLYPTLGLFVGGVEDGELSAAIARAYNDWLAEFCSHAPDRLFAAAMIPMQDIALAEAEVRRIGDLDCFRSIFIRPNPYCGRSLHSRKCDPVWKACADFDLAVAVHEGAVGNMETAGVDRFENLFFRHIIAHTVEMQIAVLCLIGGGAMERFPSLRFAFMEAGGGWIASWLDRMNDHYEGVFGAMVPWLSRKPSEYFERQCYISFDPGERTVNSVAELIGADRVIWGTDFPHTDGTYPGFMREMRESIAGFSEADRDRILGSNAATLYALD